MITPPGTLPSTVLSCTSKIACRTVISWTISRRCYDDPYIKHRPSCLRVHCTGELRLSMFHGTGSPTLKTPQNSSQIYSTLPFQRALCSKLRSATEITFPSVRLSVTRVSCEYTDDLHNLPASLARPAIWSIVKKTMLPFATVFTARRVCIALTMPWQDVCPSVCLSHAGIVSKRFFHCPVAPPF